MGFPGETGRTPEVVFDGMITTVKKNVLTGPLVAKPLQQKLGFILDQRTHLVPDEVFFDEVWQSTATAFHEGAEEQFRREVVGMRAVFVPRYITGDYPKILFRRSTVEEMIDHPTHLLGGFLEEVAHATGVENGPFPLLSIPEHSFRLTPDFTYPEVEDHLNDVKRIFNMPGGDVDLRKIQVITQGFQTNIVEISEAGEVMRYAQHPRQLQLEEARATIVQALFASKIQGASIKPFATLRDQLYLGMVSLAKLAEADPRAVHDRLVDGIDFVSAYLEIAINEADEARDLLVRLSRDNVDEFVQHLLRKKPGLTPMFTDLVTRYDTLGDQSTFD